MIVNSLDHRVMWQRDGVYRDDVVASTDYCIGTAGYIAIT